MMPCMQGEIIFRKLPYLRKYSLAYLFWTTNEAVLFGGPTPSYKGSGKRIGLREATLTIRQPLTNDVMPSRRK